MFNFSRFISVFLLFVFILNGNAQQHDDDQIDRSNYQLLWSISRDDITQDAYLFGTFHSNDKDVFNFPDSLYTILKESKAIVLETDVSTLMDEISTITSNRYETSTDLLDWMIPSHKLNKTTYTAYGSDNGRPQFIDMYFKQIADNCDKTFYPLETIADQLKVGVSMQRDLTVPNDLETLSDEELKIKYLEGDAKALYTFTKNAAIQYKGLYDALIDERNIKMAAGIDTIIKKQASTFIAVGTAHLLGPKGIIPLLRKKGYTVRPVQSKFSDTLLSDEKELKKCDSYEYVDQRFGASIIFSGKPFVKDNSQQSTRKVNYQEMGQGNTYSIQMTHHEVISNLDSIARSYFVSEDGTISDYDTVSLENITLAGGQGKIAYQGMMKNEFNDPFWIRVFHKNDIVYMLYTQGGYRFINSNRSNHFFDSFQFTNQLEDTVVQLQDTIQSPTKTMTLKFPSNSATHKEKNANENYWTAKWFNPTNGEQLYAFESILNDNTIYFKDDDFGNYLLSEYHPDSITYSNITKVPGKYKVKSFVAHKNNRHSVGKIRLLGNIIQFIQYTGKDSIRQQQFLKSFDQLSPFNAKIEEVTIRNSILKCNLTKEGLKPKEVEQKYKYRELKHYTSQDLERGISYQVFTKTFEKWAFSQKTTRQILEEQIYWPGEDTPAKIDSSFDFSGEFPTLHYSIHYTLTENRLEGKAMIMGKTIATANLLYPNFAREQYSGLTFLDSLQFYIHDSTKIDEPQLPLLKNELMIHDIKGVYQLVNNNHIDTKTMIEMLHFPSKFWSRVDEDGRLQALLIEAISANKESFDALSYWQKASPQKSPQITSAILLHFAQENNAENFQLVAQEEQTKKLNSVNYYHLFEEVKDDPVFLKEVWTVFTPYLEDSLDWVTTFSLPKLFTTDFFHFYFTRVDFMKNVMSSSQPEWAPFRYLEILYEESVTPNTISKALDIWEKEEVKNAFKNGTIIAWRSLLSRKIRWKSKRLVKKSTPIAIAYAKVMAVSETPQFNLLSYERMLGLLAFDHYEDAYSDSKKYIDFLENKTVQVDGNSVSYAFYESKENGRRYYMARKLPENEKLPSYKNFGSETYFFYVAQEKDIQTLVNQLDKRLGE